MLAVALAGDCSRLSSAAFQTMSYVADEIVARDSAAWSFIKLYYAAFYAGHALIRLFGEGCSYFGRQHTSRLGALSDALGIVPAFGIDAGLYYCVVKNAAMTCVRARGSVGGAHESFWAIFGAFIRKAAEGVLKGNLPRADAQAALRALVAQRAVHGDGIAVRRQRTSA